MKKSRFTEEQITFALKQAETGHRSRRCCVGWALRADILPLEEEALRWLGDGRVAAAEAARDENRKLEQLVADLSLDKHIL